jgi:hypothetical protein
MYMSMYISRGAPMPTDDRTTAVIPLSQARMRLFQLVDAVLAGTPPRVILSHRDRNDAVVLIRARELEMLERDLAALRARSDVGPLLGLGTLHAPLEQVIGGVRARQESLAARKRAGLGEQPGRPGPDPARAVAEPKRAYRGRKRRP